jgi:hypothetical protein
MGAGLIGPRAFPRTSPGKGRTTSPTAKQNETRRDWCLENGIISYLSLTLRGQSGDLGTFLFRVGSAGID